MKRLTIPTTGCLAGILLASVAFGQSDYPRIAVISGDYSGLPDQNAANGPEFGHSVAMHGDWLAVGAPGTTVHGQNGDAHHAGVVFMFKREDGTWQFKQRLHSVFQSMRCGTSVVMKLPYILVGCPGTPASVSAVGRARLTETGEWGAFISNTLGSGTGCGASVDMSAAHPGDGSVVAVAGCPDASSAKGHVQHAHFDGNDWQFGWSWAVIGSEIMASDGLAGDRFGESVALWHSDLTLIHRTLAVGTPNKQNGGAIDAGSVYLFNGSGWTETEILTDSGGANPREKTYFGTAVAISEKELLVGAPGGCIGANCPVPPRHGFVTYYHRNNPGAQWFRHSRRHASNNGGNPPGLQQGMRFGEAVAISPFNLVAAAAPYATGIHLQGGEIELFRPTIVPNLFMYHLLYQGEIHPGNARPGHLYEQGHLGSSMDFGNGQLAVGVPFAGFNNVRSGRVWIYELDRLFADQFED